MRLRTPYLFTLSAILALGLALGTAKKARSLGSPDFKVFHAAALHVLEDPENIYRLSPDRFLYPPSTALLLVPAALPAQYETAQWSWHALLALLLFVLSSASGAALLAMALLTRYLAITFSYGQINLVVLALLAFTARLGRQGRWPIAGATWILAASLKIYPLALAPLFFPRARRGAWLTAAAGGLFLLVLPFAAFGPAGGAQLYADFLAALAGKGLPLHSHNQSLSAFFLRVFTNTEFYLHAVGPQRWGLLDLPPAVAQSAAVLVGISLTVLTWRRAWAAGLHPAAALSATAFSVLFLSHIVWKDYLLFLYFPLRETLPLLPRNRAALLAGAFLVLVTANSPDLVGAVLSTKLDSLCIHLWAAVLVWVAWWKS